MRQIASEPLATYFIYRPSLLGDLDPVDDDSDETSSAPSSSVLGSTGAIIAQLCPEVSHQRSV